MAPQPGSIHRTARSDSGAARLWKWARSKRSPWTTLDAADAAEIAPSRARGIVAALHAAGLVECTTNAAPSQAGMVAAEYRLSPTGRETIDAPVMIVSDGLLVGARFRDEAGNVILRARVERSGLTGREVARQLGINHRTLRRMLSGEVSLMADDPVLTRVGKLK